ncbi:MAG TPA: condensation domain-containing protein, partial [Chitinophaga sp.]|uniref:condensation domain-containing protein n=1 Tax=Chitinophaga sp. TaxID=1869181 RepID=UPI002BD4A871
MPTTVLPLHPAQQDVYMDQLLHPESPCYNIGCYLILTGPLDKERFTAAIRTLPEVFDAFR